MKKMLIYILGVVIIALVGCTNTSMTKNEVSINKTKFDIIQDELKKIPKDYDLEEGINKGHFIFSYDNRNLDINILNRFIEDSSKGVSSEIIIVQYTIEGDPILTKLKYDGESYYGAIDTTRDKFGVGDYYMFEYLYFKSYKNNNEDIYYLVNDNALTNDDIESILKSEENYNAMYLFTINNR